MPTSTLLFIKDSLISTEVVIRRCSVKRYTKFTEKHLFQGLPQVFSCELCEIFKNTFFYRTPPVAASISI